MNADGYFQAGGSILDTNMSAYCGNNPVVFFDPFGERNISSTTVRNEDKNERFISCRYQSFASQKTYNPSPIGMYSGGDIYVVNIGEPQPTTWNGDVEYMYEEWDVHNKIFWGIYTFGLPGAFDSKLESSKSVDIDNNDSRKDGEYYLWTIIQNRMH